MDENLQSVYRHLFKTEGVAVVSVKFLRWQGKKNGELLGLMGLHDFDGSITSDRLMYTDRQLQRFSVPFVLIQTLHDNEKYRTPYLQRLDTFIGEHLDLLNETASGKIVVTDGIANPSPAARVHLIWTVKRVKPESGV